MSSQQIISITRSSACFLSAGENSIDQYNGIFGACGGPSLGFLSNRDNCWESVLGKFERDVNVIRSSDFTTWVGDDAAKYK